MPSAVVQPVTATAAIGKIAYAPAGYINNVRHDFGSILRLVEQNFGIAEGALTFADFAIQYRSHGVLQPHQCAASLQQDHRSQGRKLFPARPAATNRPGRRITETRLSIPDRIRTWVAPSRGCAGLHSARQGSQKAELTEPLHSLNNLERNFPTEPQRNRPEPTSARSSLRFRPGSVTGSASSY